MTVGDRIRDRPISPRSPWQNPYVERLIGTLRRDCLDRVLIFGERHLQRVMTSYSVYYNETRTHLGLGKDAPLGRAVERSGTVVAIPVLYYVIVTRGYNFRERQASNEGLGAKNCSGLEDGRKPSIQLDEQTITIREPDTPAHLPPQYDELMSEPSVLCLKSALRLERRDEQGHTEAEQRDHRRRR